MLWSAPGPRRARRALLPFALVVLSSTGQPLDAQTISPPVVEYRERASSSFQVTNNTITPLVVVLDVRGFVVDARGTLADMPLDTARTRVQLSEMSFRLPPRATRTVFYDASTTGGPGWFQVIATFTGARTANGLNLRIELPHVVYLNQAQPLAREDVVVRSAAYDTTAREVVVQLENVSDRLGRVQEMRVTGADITVPGGALPLFPRSIREARVSWTANIPPSKLSLNFGNFVVDAQVSR